MADTNQELAAKWLMAQDYAPEDRARAWESEYERNDYLERVTELLTLLYPTLKPWMPKWLRYETAWFDLPPDVIEATRSEQGPVNAVSRLIATAIDCVVKGDEK